MYKLNNKAQAEYISWYNVLVWLILAVVVIVSISIYNGGATDARAIESKALAKKIIGCIVTEDGGLIDGFDENFSIYESCAINEKIFEEDLKLYAKIELSYLNNPEPFVDIYYGNSELGLQCEIKSEGNNLAGCFSDLVVVNAPDNKGEYKIRIKTASNHDGYRIKGEINAEQSPGGVE